MDKPKTFILLNSVIVWYFTLYHTIPNSNDPENIVGKGENAGNQHFLLFQQCFLTFPKQNSIFNPFPNKPWFLHVCRTILLKTLWEKE